MSRLLEGFTLRPVAREEVATVLAPFLARLNREPERHIGYCDDTPEMMVDTLGRLSPAPEDTFRLAFEGGRLVGAFGFETDARMGRAWLFGPQVEHEAWEAVADALFAAVRPLLPEHVRELELYYDVRNTRCHEAGVRWGFGSAGDSYILRFERSRMAGVPRETAEELTPAHHEALKALHHELWPVSWMTGEQLLAKQDEHHRLLVLTEGPELLGYVFAKVQPEFGEGFIEHVAVPERVRGRGLGRRLVAAALRWMFSWDEVKVTHLVVRAENEAAVRLYRGLGYEVLHVMRAARRPWPGPGVAER
ncbi:MAG: GNAT family N-acetyltransferase [Myxococcaceae bacterium]|nr:GNAT family N-acetyltransferase [Myxococcaceae bacterium]